MSPKEKPKNSKTNNSSKQIDLNEYKALKAKKSDEEKIPMPIKIFLAFPLLVLCFILCFGIFCIPRVSPAGDLSQPQDQKR